MYMASILTVNGYILTPRVVQNYAHHIHNRKGPIIKSYFHLLSALGFLKLKTVQRGSRIYYVKTPPDEVLETSFEKVGLTYEEYSHRYHQENHKQLKNYEIYEYKGNLQSVTL